LTDRERRSTGGVRGGRAVIETGARQAPSEEDLQQHVAKGETPASILVAVVVAAVSIIAARQWRKT
jgi:hypothetical protein